jgi:DNA-binding MarR family transcriptional regulator
MTTKVDSTVLAGELRVVLGQLMRRLRAEYTFSLSQGAVLGRLDREGPRTVSDLAAAERVRPQSMAQTVGDLEVDGLVARTPDPTDGRRALVALTSEGRSVLEAERRKREGWLAAGITERMSGDEQQVLARAVPLLRRLVDDARDAPTR